MCTVCVYGHTYLHTTYIKKLTIFMHQPMTMTWAKPIPWAKTPATMCYGPEAPSWLHPRAGPWAVSFNAFPIGPISCV